MPFVWQPGVGEAVRLQRSGFSIPPTAAVTVAGLRVEKKATKNKAPIVKVTTLSTSFMFGSYMLVKQFDDIAQLFLGDGIIRPDGPESDEVDDRGEFVLDAVI